jgi:phosphotransferase system HPr (HPr) family protein
VKKTRRPGGAAGRVLSAEPTAVSSCMLNNRPGLHVRAASAFVKAAQRYKAEVRVDGGALSADGKSIVELLTLAASRGVTLRITAQGPDADRAASELAALVERGFDEDIP